MTGKNYRNVHAEWNRQNDIFNRLNIGAEEYILSLNIKPAFQQGNDKKLCCIDERIPYGVGHVPGSGILFEYNEAIDVIIASGATTMTSHDGCGAAKLWAERQGKDTNNSDEYGKEFSRQLAKDLGLGYEHIGYDKMIGPTSFHIARVGYYVGAPYFNPYKVEGMLPGFIISRRYSKQKNAQQDMELAISIAFGHHGFDGKFTKDSPFIIVPIGDSSDKEFSLASLTAELEQIANKHNNVKIDGFTAPMK